MNWFKSFKRKKNERSKQSEINYRFFENLKQMERSFQQTITNIQGLKKEIHLIHARMHHRDCNDVKIISTPFADLGKYDSWEDTSSYRIFSSGAVRDEAYVIWIKKDAQEEMK